jgi:hypothetical protein
MQAIIQLGGGAPNLAQAGSEVSHGPDDALRT